MYQKIMVPLDGSELAECVLPHVEIIAKGCRVPEVVLVSVVEPNAPFVIASQSAGMIPVDETRSIEALQKTAMENYLRKIQSRLSKAGLNVSTRILSGKTADSLINFATENNVDMVVISSHGRSGISRWVWGSVADRLLRSLCVPVTIVRAPGCISV